MKIQKKMSMRIHSKIVHENSPKVSTRIHLFCPRKFTFYVYENSATLSKNMIIMLSQQPHQVWVASLHFCYCLLFWFFFWLTITGAARARAPGQAKTTITRRHAAVAAAAAVFNFAKSR